MVTKRKQYFRFGLAVGLVAGLVAAAPASVAAAPLFTVEESAGGANTGTIPNLVIGDRISYDFQTQGTQTFNPDGTGTFTELGSVQASAILCQDPACPGGGVGAAPPQQLTNQEPSPLFPEPGNLYGMYALFSGSGTTEPIPPTATSPGGIKGIFDTFEVRLFLDPERDTNVFANPGTAVDGGGAADDLLIATGVLAPASECPTDVSCGISHSFPLPAQGDFGVLVVFDLTALGELYFIDPDPFYARLRVTGVSSLLTPINEQITRNQGAGQGFFEVTQVPEPASMLLLGLGLVGLSVANYRRRK